MIVCKFGGSSCANAVQIRKVCDIVLADADRKIVVVSAPGKRNPEDTKVTDLLITLGNAMVSGYDGNREREAVIGRFATISSDLGLDGQMVEWLREDLDHRLASGCDNRNRFMDLIKSAGEDYCARLFHAYLTHLDVKATYVSPATAGMVVTSEFGNAQILPDSYDKLSTLDRIPGILVFPGFFGVTREGEVATFSRGGSDITGSILAAALQASVYENWTDVDCVYAVNPALVSNPHPIHEITYDEMRELAYAGFSVLHEEALVPAFRKGIPVFIRNTNNPSSRGTMIVNHRSAFDGIVTGIAGAKGFCSITLNKYLMNREVGFALKVLQILADEGISFDHMPSGIDSLSIVLRSSMLPHEKEETIKRRLIEEIGVEHVEVTRNLSIVMIVGAAMARTVGVTARAATALARAGVNLEVIIQGASEISVMFGVREEFCDFAIRELYKEFFPR